MSELISLKEFLTIGAAVLGAALGIMNTWNAVSQQRLKLKVSPAHAIAVPRGPNGLAIEIINLSSFPVTISEAGLTSPSNSIHKGERYPIINPLLVDGKPWPRRLEPREAVSIYSATPTQDVGIAYAKTSCGEVRYGDSPALKQIRQALRG